MPVGYVPGQMVERKGGGLCRHWGPGFASPSYDVPALWPWVSHFTCVHVSLLCQLTVRIPTAQVGWDQSPGPGPAESRCTGSSFGVGEELAWGPRLAWYLTGRTLAWENVLVLTHRDR